MIGHQSLYMAEQRAAEANLGGIHDNAGNAGPDAGAAFLHGAAEGVKGICRPLHRTIEGARVAERACLVRRQICEEREADTREAADHLAMRSDVSTVPRSATGLHSTASMPVR